MKSTIYKLGTAVASSALLLASAGSFAMAGQTITINGNGSNSTNNATTTTLNTSFVTQRNQADINNHADIDSNTGHNEANGNTGGSVDVRSGNSNVDVKIDNKANSNVANVQNCGCPGDLKVAITGNGSGSANDANVTRVSTNVVSQDNDAHVQNHVDVDANTGWNEADDNTGSDVTLRSGRSDVKVKLDTAVNHNVASVGGGTGSGRGDDVMVIISGNGSNSRNNANLDLLSTVFLDQTNRAWVDNDADVDSNTGHNEADGNTGGDVRLTSGPSSVDIDARTLANFNAANIDQCCPAGIKADISGNGTRSDNRIDALLDSFLVASQDNDARVHNRPDVDGNTGWNEADDNTGKVNGMVDPSLTSGGSDVMVRLSSEANKNVLGTGSAGLTGISFGTDSAMSLLMRFFGLVH